MKRFKYLRSLPALFIFITASLIGHSQARVKQNNLYNYSLGKYLDYVNTTRSTKFDTLFIQKNDTIDYHLAPAIGHTIIQVLTWAELAEKIQAGQVRFYIHISPLTVAYPQTSIVFAGFQVETDENELVVGAQRRYEEVIYTNGRKKQQYRFQSVATRYGYCTYYYRFGKNKRDLELKASTCI